VLAQLLHLPDLAATPFVTHASGGSVGGQLRLAAARSVSRPTAEVSALWG
jgi:hypothetical protein